MSKRNIRNSKFKRGALIGGSALLMAVSAPSLVAQEVNAAINAEKERKDVEVIEVTGVRSSLEDALNTKREAPSRPGKYPEFTEKDSLKGYLNENRSCFDVTYYNGIVYFVGLPYFLLAGQLAYADI